MPQISNQKKQKISEQILAFLFNTSPSPRFTSEISQEIARDEEFVKILLQDLKDKGLVILIDKGPSGIKYSRRQRWRLSNKAHEAYSRIRRV